MARYNYVIWRTGLLPQQCRIAHFTDDGNGYRLRYGLPYAHHYPNEYFGSMDAEQPNNTVLFDVVANNAARLIVSDSLKRFLEEEILGPVEFLPLIINDQEQQKESGRYWFVNSLDPVDCIDFDRSDYDENPVDDSIMSVDKLVVDESKIDPERNFFRMQALSSRCLVHKTLAEKIDAAGFTNVRWEAIEKHVGV